VAGRSAEVKEEPAGESRRAGDTQQSALPPKFLGDESENCTGIDSCKRNPNVG
jgi:hypothetical protein